MLKGVIKKKEQNNDLVALNTARILYYDFFSGLFIYDLLLNREELLKKQIEILSSQPLNQSNSNDFIVLLNELNNNGIKNLVFEYTNLFMLPFDGTIESKSIKHTKKGKVVLRNTPTILYLSYYLDGSIAGSGLLKARELVKKSRFRLNETSFRENEEHFGFLLSFMKHLLQNNQKELQLETFNTCLKPMQGKIIQSLKAKGDMFLYANIANLLESFMDFEMGFVS